MDSNTGRLTIVTPTYEKHFEQFSHMVESISAFCQDTANLKLLAVVEEHNRELFSTVLARFPRLSSRILSTEESFGRFGITEAAGELLARSGKFPFQALKKLGALASAETAWSLVLDSETLFHKPFRAADLLADYARQKYVFFTETAPRGRPWTKSTGHQVNLNCGEILGFDANRRWYMEYFHWFYETDKVRELLDGSVGRALATLITDPARENHDVFENVLYYLFLERYYSDEYQFVDFKQLLDETLPAEIARRFDLRQLPFSLFGNEYLLNILRPEEVSALATLFERYRLPFVRLEPPFFDTRYVPELLRLPHFVATISSHHLMWLKKKIAICISGEFRHVIHRTPEHHIRHLLGFLSGVDCDIYVHGWSNSSEALIIDQLKPRAYLFEPQPSFAALARRITCHEPKLKPGRDEGSLAMFYGIERCFELMDASRDEYDYVLRIRPDLYIDRSLKEILVSISDEGDFLPGAIYFPKHFNSKGINDQFALGRIEMMTIYSKTFSYIEDNIDRLFFNPESVLLKNLLENEVELAVLDIPYALVRHHPIRAATVSIHLRDQERTWWSKTDDLPSYVDLTTYFQDRLRSMEWLIRVQPKPTYIPVSHNAVIRVRNEDNSPSLQSVSITRWSGFDWILPFYLEGRRLVLHARQKPRQLFVYEENGGFVVSEWRRASGKLLNNRLVASSTDLAAAPRLTGLRLFVGWQTYYVMRHMAQAVVWCRRKLLPRRTRIDGDDASGSISA